MARSQPPNGEQPAGSADQPYPPTQYPSAQYPPPQYPPAQYPPAQYPPGPNDGAGPSVQQYGQSNPATQAPNIALPTGPSESQPSVPVSPQQPGQVKPNRRPTRIGAAWVALIVAAVVMIFLLIFIVQNSGPVQIRYFGFEGTVSLGVAMLFAAVAGALTAGLLGTVRILQLRKKARALAQK